MGVGRGKRREFGRGPAHPPSARRPFPSTDADGRGARGRGPAGSGREGGGGLFTELSSNVDLEAPLGPLGITKPCTFTALHASTTATTTVSLPLHNPTTTTSTATTSSAPGSAVTPIPLRYPLNHPFINGASLSLSLAYIKVSPKGIILATRINEEVGAATLLLSEARTARRSAYPVIKAALLLPPSSDPTEKGRQGGQGEGKAPSESMPPAAAGRRPG